MVPRRKNKLFLGVLVIGGAALIVDRVFVGSPAATPEVSLAGETAPPAKPSPMNPAPHAAGAPAAGDGTGLSLSVPELPFPRELPVLASGERLRDVFARPRSSLRDPDTADGSDDNPDEPANERDEDNPRDRAKDFPQRHRLDGVFLDEGLKIAVVDGSWVAIGGNVDGCELTAIDGNQAKFRCGDREISLRTDPASTSEPR